MDRLDKLTQPRHDALTRCGRSDHEELDTGIDPMHPIEATHRLAQGGA